MATNPEDQRMNDLLASLQLKYAQNAQMNAAAAPTWSQTAGLGTAVGTAGFFNYPQGSVVMTSTGATQFTYTAPNPPPPIRATDLVLDEDGVHILVANQRMLLVPKELLVKLEALMRMATLAGLVCPADSAA